MKPIESELFERFGSHAIIRPAKDGSNLRPLFPLPWAMKLVEACIEKDIAVYRMESFVCSPPYTYRTPRMELISGSLYLKQGATWGQERDGRNVDALALLREQNPDAPLLFEFFLMSREDFEGWSQ